MDAIPSRHLGDAVRVLDLPAALASTRRQLASAPAHHTASTLVKQPGMRVVALALEQGARIPPHRAEAEITVQVLSGRIVFRVGETGERVLGRGQLIGLRRGLEHALLALEPSELLLTIGGEDG
jgi:quercetin dioxygenase-like cupin family protein